MYFNIVVMKKVLGILLILGILLPVLSSCEGMFSTPEIVVEDQQVVLPAEGGDYSLAFEIVNPKKDGVLDVTLSEGCDWIKVNGASTNEVTLSYAENAATENRAATVILSYKYGSNEVIVSVNMIQEFIAYDFKHEIVTAVFNWYGSTSGKDRNMSNFYIQMCDNTNPKAPGSHTIFFDLFTAEVPKDNVPVAGVYSPAECGEETDFTYCNYDTFIWEMNEDGSAYKYLRGFVEGEIVITRDGGHLSIRALLTDEKGSVHYIKYDGDPEIVDGTVESNLASDWNATVNGSEAGPAMAVFHGDGYTANSNTWQFQIWPEECEPKDYVFFAEFYTPTDVNLETGFPDGIKFTMDEEDAGAPYTYSEGFSGFQGTWLLQVYEVTGVSLTFGAQTPLKEGSISFKLNDDGTYDMHIEAVDDNRETPHHINVLFDNIKVEFLDPSETASVSRSSVPAAGLQTKRAR